MSAVSPVCPLAGGQAGEQLLTSPVQSGRSLSWDSRADRVQETAGDKNIQVKSVLADFMIYLLFPETNDWRHCIDQGKCLTHGTIRTP